MSLIKSDLIPSEKSSVYLFAINTLLDSIKNELIDRLSKDLTAHESSADINSISNPSETERVQVNSQHKPDKLQKEKWQNQINSMWQTKTKSKSEIKDILLKTKQRMTEIEGVEFSHFDDILKQLEDQDVPSHPSEPSSDALTSSESESNLVQEPNNDSEDLVRVPIIDQNSIIFSFSASSLQQEDIVSFIQNYIREYTRKGSGLTFKRTTLGADIALMVTDPPLIASFEIRKNTQTNKLNLWQFLQFDPTVNDILSPVLDNLGTLLKTELQGFEKMFLEEDEISLVPASNSTVLSNTTNTVNTIDNSVSKPESNQDNKKKKEKIVIPLSKKKQSSQETDLESQQTAINKPLIEEQITKGYHEDTIEVKQTNSDQITPLDPTQTIDMNENKSISDIYSKLTNNPLNFPVDKPFEAIPETLDSIDEIHTAYEEIEKANQYLPLEFNLPNATAYSNDWIRERADRVGMNLEKFDDHNFEDQTLKQLHTMIKSRKQSGIYNILKEYDNTTQHSIVRVDQPIPSIASTKWVETPNKMNKQARYERKVNFTSTRFASNVDPYQDNVELSELFKIGKRISTTSLDNILDRANNLKSSDLDLLEAMDIEAIARLLPNLSKNLTSGMKMPSSNTDFDKKNMTLDKLFPSTPKNSAYWKHNNQKTKSYETNWKSFQVFVHDLFYADKELYPMILDGQRELLLSQDFIFLLKESLFNLTISHRISDQFPILQSLEDIRKYQFVYEQIVAKTLELYKQVEQLILQETVYNYQLIQQFCQVMLNIKSYTDEELYEEIQYFKQFFNMHFLSFVNYMIQEETLHIEEQQSHKQSAPQTTRWLQLLTLIQKGILEDYARRYDSLIELLEIMIRFIDFYSKYGIRDQIVVKKLLQRVIEDLPVADLPYLRTLAVNIIKNIRFHSEGTAVEEDFVHYQDQQTLEYLKNNPQFVQHIDTFEQIIEEHLSEEFVQNKLHKYTQDLQNDSMNPVEVTFEHKNADIEEAIQAEKKAMQDSLLRGDFVVNPTPGIGLSSAFSPTALQNPSHTPRSLPNPNDTKKIKARLEAENLANSPQQQLILGSLDDETDNT